MLPCLQCSILRHAKFQGDDKHLCLCLLHMASLFVTAIIMDCNSSLSGNCSVCSRSYFGCSASCSSCSGSCARCSGSCSDCSGRCSGLVTLSTAQRMRPSIFGLEVYCVAQAWPRPWLPCSAGRGSLCVQRRMNT